MTIYIEATDECGKAWKLQLDYVLTPLQERTNRNEDTAKEGEVGPEPATPKPNVTPGDKNPVSPTKYEAKGEVIKVDGSDPIISHKDCVLQKYPDAVCHVPGLSQKVGIFVYRKSDLIVLSGEYDTEDEAWTAAFNNMLESGQDEKHKRGVLALYPDALCISIETRGCGMDQQYRIVQYHHDIAALDLSDWCATESEAWKEAFYNSIASGV